MLSDLLVRNTNGELAEKIRQLEESYKKNHQMQINMEAQMRQAKEQSLMVINKQFNIQNQKMDQLMAKKKRKLCVKGNTQVDGMQLGGPRRNTMMFKPDGVPSLANMAKIVQN